MEVPPEFLAKQLDAVFTDIRPDAVKIGMVSSGALIEVIADKFLEWEKASNELDEVKKFYKKDVQKIKVNTPDKATNLLLNGFLLYQALVCRIFGKSSFYQSGGATGFRDQLQDVMPFSFIVSGNVSSANPLL